MPEANRLETPETTESPGTPETPETPEKRLRKTCLLCGIYYKNVHEAISHRAHGRHRCLARRCPSGGKLLHIKGLDEFLKHDCPRKYLFNEVARSRLFAQKGIGHGAFDENKHFSLANRIAESAESIKRDEELTERELRGEILTATEDKRPKPFVLKNEIADPDLLGSDFSLEKNTYYGETIDAAREAYKRLFGSYGADISRSSWVTTRQPSSIPVKKPYRQPRLSQEERYRIRLRQVIRESKKASSSQSKDRKVETQSALSENRVTKRRITTGSRSDSRTRNPNAPPAPDTLPATSASETPEPAHSVAAPPPAAVMQEPRVNMQPRVDVAPMWPLAPPGSIPAASDTPQGQAQRMTMNLPFRNNRHSNVPQGLAHKNPIDRRYIVSRDRILSSTRRDSREGQRSRSSTPNRQIPPVGNFSLY